MLKTLAIIMLAATCHAVDIVLGIGAPTFTGSGNVKVASWGTPDVLDGLIAWWKMDAINAGVISDYSGRGNDLTVHGTASVIAGPKSSAVQFDVSNGYAVSDSYDGENFAAITICMWVKGAQAGKYLLCHTDASRALVYGFQTGAANLYNFGYPTGNPADTAMTVDSAAWVHVVYTADGSTIRAFRNGVKVVEVSGAFTRIEAVAPWVVSASGVSGGDYSGASFYEVRIYDRAVSEPDVTTIYNATK